MGYLFNHTLHGHQSRTLQTVKRSLVYFEFRSAVLDIYWISLAGSEDLYMHFAEDILYNSLFFGIFTNKIYLGAVKCIPRSS